MGVTRLSLGIENFDEQILQANGRAHGAKEIDASYQFARAIGFPQINIDLIAGMVGETDQNWRECVRKTIALSPDSVTIYQMEVPLQHDDLQRDAGAWAGGRACGQLARQARLGRLRVFRDGEGRLHHRQCVHRGERSGTHAVSCTATCCGPAPT